MDISMRKKSYLFYIAICISLLLASSCQSYDESLSTIGSEQGQFVVKHPKEYSISITRGMSDTKTWSKETCDAKMEITESDWETGHSNATRSSNIGDDVKWINSPSVGLYISDADGNMKVKNVPLNPSNHIIQDYWYDENPENTPAEEVAAIKKEAITSASFFWSTWSQYTMTPTSGANFYGIYPRPWDHSSRPYKYVRNSIISSSSVNGTDNSISYVFWTAQTDQNIRQFDLMYSKSEPADGAIFGNQNKHNGESILMPFEHVFSLLNIEIYMGKDYTGVGKLSEISIKGTEVPTTGTFNYVTGELTKGTDEGVINRTIEESVLSKDVPFVTEIIVPPSSDNTTKVDGKERLALICKIDGNEYKYEFPDNIKLARGKKYNLKLTLSPSGLSYINVWDGAIVTLDSDTKELAPGSRNVLGNRNFTVKAKDNYAISKITKNGEILALTEGTYDIEKNCTYNIVAYPKNDWYACPGDMRVQFDGIMNTAYQNAQNKSTSTWQDLSGNDNNGNLKSFDNTSESGWNGKGLVFDGVDDIVIFPGTVNASTYTMEFLIAFDKQKSGATPRLNAEGTAYPAYYLRNMKKGAGSEAKWYVGLFGHGCSLYDSDLSIEDDNSLVQLDMIYENHKVSFYKNGEFIEDTSRYGGTLNDAISIPEASLGNRSADNTRTTTGTYYSYILYDKALSPDEMRQNLRINQKRYQQTK